ncbi:MAG TPA: YkgJ family cysteine cluster protein [Nodosilinea sp.]|nr:YkgJ family cysteine cluster protein [Nodosilinea sp.]
MSTWQCVKSCGACCFLAPDERPELEEYLAPDQLALYLSLVGDNGWCIHYDDAERRCTIYADRPDFCRVTAPTFEAMFGIPSDELDDFAIDCCQEHIADIYGEESAEMERFTQAVGVEE